jgi:hypothetical protein
MRKALFLFTVALSLLTACGEDVGLRGKTDRGGLSDSDYTAIKTINALQLDNMQARDSVYPMMETDVDSSAVGNGNLEKMAKSIAENCSSSGKIPKDEMGGANNTQTVANGSGNCPIYWHRQRSFIPATQTFVFIDNFEARSPEYLAMAPVVARRISGDFRASWSGTTRNVLGSMTFSEYEIKGLGRLRGGITIQASYPTTDRGGGSVSLTLVAPRWQHTATVQWSVQKFSPAFYIDGNEVDRKTFDELFSSFELTKIMENSLKMR